MDYSHELQLAPTQAMLDNYKKHGAKWVEYEHWFIDLISERRIDERIPLDFLDNSVLLCSEPTAHHCHRRLVAEYLAEKWDDVTIEHL